MILVEIETYISQHKRVALIDLSNRLGIEPEAIREMLRLLERKGRVRKLPSGTVCGGGCTRCAPGTVELFEWSGQA